MLSLPLLAAVAAPVPSGWTLGSPDVGNAELTLHVALKHAPGTEDAARALHATVSDPTSPKYGAFMTKAELAAALPAAAGAEAGVHAWCAAIGARCSTVNLGDVVAATAPAATFGSAFGIKLGLWTHPQLDAGAAVVRALEGESVTLPPSLAPHATVVTQLETFPTLAAPHHRLGSAAGAPSVTPARLRAAGMYNITDNATAGSKASMAVVEFQGQGYLPSDLAKFESTFGLPAQTCRNVTGPSDTTKIAGVEASLDIQYILATGTGVPVDFYLHEGNDFDLLGWASFVQGQAEPPLVHSMSYGEGVNGGNGGTIPVAQTHQLDLEMVKLGLRGISVLIASGDSGVYNRIPFESGHFHPSYPCCLPSVTCVGATEWNADGTEDSAVSFSGGGFTPSAYFTRDNATWQEIAVTTYLQSGVKLPPHGKWDSKGRGVPDVSAVGVGFEVITQGHSQPVSGTSASTPVVAGVFALLNDLRLAAGKSPLGFLNPFIYQNAHAFRDIMKGENNDRKFLKTGFYAAKGWDPVTGVGTPLFPLLKAAALDDKH